MGAVRLPYGRCDSLRAVARVDVISVDGLNVEEFPLAVDMWSVQASAKSVGVERGRHHNYAQVRTDNLLGFKR